MRFSAGRLAAAGVIVGLLGIGGAGYAYAQSSSTTPSTTTPGSGGGGQGHSGVNCPNMGPNNTQSSSSQM
jgi:hypothetical protein